MSISANSRDYRKLNVDELGENNFQDEEEQSSFAGPNANEVNSLLMGKKNLEALTLCLDQSPLGTSNKTTLDNAFMLTMRVLTAFKSSEVAASVKQLNKLQVDTLMKYIYRGFSEPPSDNSGSLLLTFHDEATKIGGLGSIVRVLTDRKTV